MDNSSPLIQSESTLQGLNPPQVEAVCHFEGPILVLAGAGSGKTRVLTRRVTHLILHRDVDPTAILAVTFTNKATEEMRERLRHQLGSRADQLWVATFHSASLRMLRRHARYLGYTNDFVVYDEQDSKSTLKEVLKELNIDEKKHPISMFSRTIDQAKNAMLTPERFAEQVNSSSYDGKLRAQVYAQYQLTLKKANAMDFGDLLLNAVLLLKEHREVLELYRRLIHFILVDEFQDTNPVQYEFVRLLAAPRNNLLVVGDDDQSIYAFRGATIQNILDFEKDFPGSRVVKLEQNYRSSATILEAAHAVIEKNRGRKSKKLWTSRPAENRITTFIGDDETDEASFIAREIKARSKQGMKYQQIAVFYRTNAQSRAIEEALITEKIPYKIFGGLKYYDRKEIKDILAYLRLVVNESDNQAFMRTINTPPRGIGPTTLQGVLDYAKNHGTSLLQAAAGLVREHPSTKTKAIAAFVQLLAEFKALAQRAPLSELIATVIKKTEYTTRLEAGKDPASESRIDNLRELEAIGRSMEDGITPPWEALTKFLDRVALTASADNPSNRSVTTGEDTSSVSLMTLHLAKGLEFPMVFLTGMEEGLLPHYKSLDDPVGLEEERRLCYVGITRAMDQLILTRCEQRGMFSSGDGFGLGGMFRLPSRFAKDLPKDCLNDLSGAFATRKESPVFIEDEDDDSDSEEPDPLFATGRSRVRRSPVVQSLGGGGYRAKQRLVAAADELRLREASEFLTTRKEHRAGGDSRQGAGSLRKRPDAPSAQPSDLFVGARVLHSVFGEGTVEKLEGDAAVDAEFTVFVKFDQREGSKKLILKYAKLWLVPKNDSSQ